MPAQMPPNMSWEEIVRMALENEQPIQEMDPALYADPNAAPLPEEVPVPPEYEMPEMPGGNVFRGGSQVPHAASPLDARSRLNVEDPRIQAVYEAIVGGAPPLPRAAPIPSVRPGR